MDDIPGGAFIISRFSRNAANTLTFGSALSFSADALVPVTLSIITTHDASLLLVNILSQESFSNELIEAIESNHRASAWSGVLPSLNARKHLHHSGGRSWSTYFGSFSTGSQVDLVRRRGTRAKKDFCHLNVCGGGANLEFKGRHHLLISLSLRTFAGVGVVWSAHAQCMLASQKSMDFSPRPEFLKIAPDGL